MLFLWGNTMVALGEWCVYWRWRTLIHPAWCTQGQGREDLLRICATTERLLFSIFYSRGKSFQGDNYCLCSSSFELDFVAKVIDSYKFQHNLPLGSNFCKLLATS
jgi:hypothetical protein